MPGDFESAEGPTEEEKGCCERLCECWCQLIIIGIAITIIIALMSGLFW